MDAMIIAEYYNTVIGIYAPFLRLLFSSDHIPGIWISPQHPCFGLCGHAENVESPPDPDRRRNIERNF